MNYLHDDDDSIMTGVIMTLMVFTSAIGGYWIRDIGITFKVQAPPVQRVVR